MTRMPEMMPGFSYKWVVFTKATIEPDLTEHAKAIYERPVARDNEDRGGKHRWLVYLDLQPKPWTDEEDAARAEAYRLDAMLRDDPNVASRYKPQSDRDYEAEDGR